MPDPQVITTHSGQRLSVHGLDLRIPYSLYCQIDRCSLTDLDYMLQHFQPAQQPNLQLRFLEPVSRLVAGSTLTLFEHTYPRVGPFVVQAGVDAATTFFQTGNPDWNATGRVDLRARVWRELHFFVDGEVQVRGSGVDLHLDHGEFKAGFQFHW